jgi:hypothetical protein
MTDRQQPPDDRSRLWPPTVTDAEKPLRRRAMFAKATLAEAIGDKLLPVGSASGNSAVAQRRGPFAGRRTERMQPHRRINRRSP